MIIEDVLNEIGVKLAYNRDETAKLISQSPATLDRLAARGLIQPNRATRRPVYPLEEILRYLSTGKKEDIWINRGKRTEVNRTKLPNSDQSHHCKSTNTNGGAQ
jgi:hypothetical protein